jgi:hypothetical protein
MSTQYQIRIYSRAGTLQHVITDMLQLSYVREVNTPGMLSAALPPRHAAIADLGLDSQVEVWRANAAQGIDWYCDFRALWRGEIRQANDDGTAIYQMQCPGQLSLLGRALVAYRAGTANRSAFGATRAETLAKTLVSRNATSVGTTADGRVRNVTLTGIAVEPDAARGNDVELSCAWRNVLDVLVDVAAIGGGDFDLVKTGPQAWEFRWYPLTRGTDRRGAVVFALEYGNISSPKLTRSYLQEKTAAIVAGQGADSSRTVVVRTGANYEAGYNDTETLIDARHLLTTTALQAAGDAALVDARARNELSFGVLQVPQTLYGLHYFLGDLVTARYESVVATKKIRRVAVGVQADGSEDIQVELVDAYV